MTIDRICCGQIGAALLLWHRDGYISTFFWRNKSDNLDDASKQCYFTLFHSNLSVLKNKGLAY